jgi:hypothetical protein
VGLPRGLRRPIAGERWLCGIERRTLPLAQRRTKQFVHRRLPLAGLGDGEQIQARRSGESVVTHHVDLPLCCGAQYRQR